AAAAHARRLDVLVEMWLDARSVLHRLRRDHVVFEGPGKPVGRTRPKCAGNGILEEVLEWRHPRRGVVFPDPMADRAAGAVSRQRTIFKMRTPPMGDWQEIEQEVPAIVATVDIELTFPHDTVA